MVNLLAAVGLGFVLGMRHATDPDHVIAVSTIVSRQRSIRQAGIIGALWGVGPASQDQEVGRFWLLTSEEIGAEARDMVALSIMILPEMLSHYRRLESVIDARNERAVELVKLIGFTIEPALTMASRNSSTAAYWSARLYFQSAGAGLI